MANIYYPPIIEGKIPAQIGNTLRIPFTHNKANELSNFKVKIKTVSTNRDIATLNGIENDGVVEISVLQSLLTVGQFYKVQLAYCDDNGENVGYYSSVGVFKYTSSPSITIDATSLQYIGKFNTSNSDPSEKLYSYVFNTYYGDNLIHTTGELLHNATQDTGPTSAENYFYPNFDLSQYGLCAAEYIATTASGLVISSGRTMFPTYDEGVGPLEGIELTITPNREEGYNEVIISSESRLCGNFYIYRDFDVIVDLTIDTDNKTYSYKDFTIEHNKEYVYAIRQYNGNIMTSKVYSNPVACDFEHAYLYDGNRQLKIKFNPKVTSFKDTILETKIDTIGGRYPFIFRNARTKYKEFPISGLISYQLDDNEMFISKEELMLDENLGPRSSTNAGNLPQTDFNTNLTSLNISAERIFKLKVLEWLNNGKPKVFRSPTEGNYIVRLMNVSLTPNDTVGRMLHTFNAQACEIQAYDFNNLKELEIIGNKYTDVSYLYIEEQALTEAQTLPQNTVFSYIDGVQNNEVYLLNTGASTVQVNIGPNITRYNLLSSVRTVSTTSSNVNSKLCYGYIGKDDYPIVGQSRSGAATKVIYKTKVAQIANAEFDMTDVIAVSYLRLVANPNGEGGKAIINNEVINLSSAIFDGQAAGDKQFIAEKVYKNPEITNFEISGDCYADIVYVVREVTA